VRSGDDLGAADATRLLPIRSPGLTPGVVARRTVKRSDAIRIFRPFFLVGSDLRSREWLATHRDRLEQLGAVGMLVQAENVEDLEAMARIAEGLPVLPASATDIARVMGLAHFPVLVSRRGIEQ
jgi:integrating conjugative element protein (TIGR03765 family)